MNKKRIIISITILLAFIVFLSYKSYYDQRKLFLSQISPHHIAPEYLYPSQSTKGDYDTQSIDDLTKLYNGVTYSQAHRNVSNSKKEQVCKLYDCTDTVEIDHFIPLSIGGSNDIENLWAQPKVSIWNGTNWGFGRKDALESVLAIQVKSGKIKPEDAQRCIVNDWILCYQKYVQNTVGSSVIDNDDEIQQRSQ